MASTITEPKFAYLDMKMNPSDSGKTPLEKGSRGSAACAGLFGAILRAGSAAERTGQVGDAILIDPAKGLFAIGDSSDRELSAARFLLRKFSDVQNSIPILFAYNPLNGIRRVTKKYFWFLGKAREFYQVEVFDVNPGDRFLLAPVGLQDLSPPEGKEFVSYLAELFSSYPVEDIPDILINYCDTKSEGKDDIALYH